MLKLFGYPLVFIITIRYILKHKHDFYYTINLFFNHGRFDNLSTEYTKQNGRTEEQLDINQQLRKSIWQSFKTVSKILAFAWFIACITTDSFINPFSLPLILQIGSAFLILWALVGKLGYSIRTWSGNTLPERIDNFWFIFLNVLGILLLFFEQFYNSCEIVSPVHSSFGTNMVTYNWNFVRNGLIFSCNFLSLFLLEMLLIWPIFCGLYMEIKNLRNSSLCVITRGDKSWSYFVGFFAMTSAIYLQIISNTEQLGEYKNIIILINLLVLAHTSFRNRWFRNSIIGIISRVKKWTD